MTGTATAIDGSETTTQDIAMRAVIAIRGADGCAPAPVAGTRASLSRPFPASRPKSTMRIRRQFGGGPVEIRRSAAQADPSGI